jgi:hypothetical protein
MGPAAVLLLILAGNPPAAQAEQPGRQPVENCAVCHGKEHVELERGVHARAGFTCVSCHGGVAEAIEAEGAHTGDFRPLTDPRDSVASCGECHSDVERMRVSGLRTDQLALYRTSQHGSMLFETGNTDVATCVDCHGSHDIRQAADPAASVHPRNQPETCGACHADAALMDQYELPSDASDRYARSVHGLAVADGRLASPACSDCHGHHGALPPRVDDTEQVCGNCHSVVQEQHERGPHFGIEPAVQCVTCHGNHLVLPPSSEALVGEGPGSCSTCHREAGDPGRAVALGLHEDLALFEEHIEATAEAARRAGSRGLYLDQEMGFLADARGVLVRARSVTHSASREDLDDLLNRGLGMVSRTEDSLAKLSRLDRDRRIFTAAFFALTVALALMLLMYAREIRGKGRARAPEPRPARGAVDDGR